MADNPVFAVIPEITNNFPFIVNALKDGSGSGYVTIASGARLGTRVAEIVVQATGTTVAGLIGLHLSGVGVTTGTLPNNTPCPLFDEITIAGNTSSPSAKAYRLSTVYNNLVLSSGQFLLARNTIANQGINVIVLGADL